MNAVTFSAAFAALSLVVFLLAKPFDKRLTIGSILLCVLYLALDDLATGLPSVISALDIFGGNWNWSGKVLSLALSALVIVALGLSPATIGLTLKQRHIGIGITALVLYIVWGSCLGWYFNPGAGDAETLWFQGTMPSLSEELVYRGIAPVLLLGLIRQKGPITDTPWAVILSTSVVFGLWHGLRYSGGEFGFDIMSALFPFIGSIPGCWLRFKTGSLVVPVLAHSFANVAFFVASGWLG